MGLPALRVQRGEVERRYGDSIASRISAGRLSSALTFADGISHYDLERSLEQDIVARSRERESACTRAPSSGAESPAGGQADEYIPSTAAHRKTGRENTVLHAA